MVALKLYNTMGKKLEEFRPINPPYVNMYTCGPTVYDFAHIGNFRTFVFQDILRKYLRYKGFIVFQCCNITDVDDKTIRASRAEGISLIEYTQRYEKAFFEDLEILNIEKAEVYPKATEHIDDIIRLIKKLLEKGYAYESEGSIYFDVSRFAEYGKMSGVSVSSSKIGYRVKADEYGKEHAQDFALWKAWDPEDGNVYWDTDLGKGRPGWHIECSAMSMKYLGETFDLHTGGVDLIFPHHENEIAQSEAAIGKPFVKFWLHCEHLMVDGQKMAKTLGNYYTLRDLLKEGYDPLAIRYLLLLTNYRVQLNLSREALEQAQNSLMRILSFIDRAKRSPGFRTPSTNMLIRLDETRRRFQDAMDDDLNTPVALAAIFDFIRETNRAIDKGNISDADLEGACSLIQEFNSVLGILKTEEIEIEADLKRMVELREDARKNKNWELADRIRKELLEKGIVLEDTPQGVRWKKKRISH